MASKPDPAGLMKLFGCALRQACLAALLLGLSLGCSKKESPAPPLRDTRPNTVYTVNYPLAYFARRLAPRQIEVVFPVPREVDPAYWKPSTEQIGQYQTAGLILLNGAGYARWTEHATLPKARTVDTSQGCRESFLRTEETLRHQHGPEGEHAHEGFAFTTWLDMDLARCQASRVRDALIDMAPADEDSIRSSFAELGRELSDLDTRLHKAAAAWNAEPMLASHPVYQYLAEAYGLRVKSFHWEPEQVLDSDELQTLDAALSQQPTKLMLWEAPPRTETKRQLNERKITTVVFDPSSQPPAKGDFLTVMRANADRLACATGAETCR